MKREKSSKRKKLTITIEVLLFLIIIIGGYTYSRYTSSGSTISTTPIAQWSVKIGENDLNSYTTDTPLITPVTLSESEFIAPGYIAPGRKGTYSIELDPTGSQVAIDYLINISNNTAVEVENSKIKVTEVKCWIGEVTGEGTNLEIQGKWDIVVREALNDVLANKKVTLKITIEWENDESNNETDTIYGSEATTLDMINTITARQRLSTDE